VRIAPSINEFAYRVGVFGFLEHGDRIGIFQCVVLNQCAAGRRAVCTRTSMRANQRCLKESAGRRPGLLQPELNGAQSFSVVE
jgi:hypothetical protein